jgi:hypothetical protein
VKIIRYVDDGFPGWVEAEFLDGDNHRHVVIDKVPILTSEVLDSTSAYPRNRRHTLPIIGAMARR